MLQILSAALPDLQLLTLADFTGAPEPEETGTTYPENAAIKSESAAAFTGEWCVADDAGLEIDFFQGAPGVYSKRFEGEETPFQVKMERILERMKGVPPSARGARFRCYIALSHPKAETILFNATCEGQIADSISGSGGFGYDPIFWLPNRGCTMADLTKEEKHAVSHRGKVLAQLVDYLVQNPLS